MLTVSRMSLTAAGWCLVALIGGEGAGAVPAAASAPAKAPGNPRIEARRLAESVLKQLGEGYTSRIDSKRHIVYVSALDDTMLRRAMDLLGSYHDVLGRTFFSAPARRNIVVVLPTLKDYRKRIPTRGVHGVYVRKTRTLWSISFSGVLIHEFVHALHHRQQAALGQEHPIWIVEGLATLLQSSRIDKGGLTILKDRQLATVQSAIRTNTAIPLRTLVAMNQKAFLDRRELCYAQARSTMGYLHQLGKLDEFYTAFRRDYSSDATGLATVCRVLGRSAQQVERDWKAWVLSRKPPWAPARRARAHLGVRMKATPAGVKITGFVRGSTAQRVGRLQVGDTILSIAGRTVGTAREVTRAVQSCRPGQIVEIEAIRGGRVVRVMHLLGAISR